MAFKIYTKTGDKGTTALYGGARVPKHHIRIEAYGTIDELNSFIGLVADLAGEKTEFLRNIQYCLFNIGAIMATQPDKPNLLWNDLKESDVEALEKDIDTMEEELEPLKYFILPGGSTLISYCHLARTVCRRAERLATALHELEPLPTNLILLYLNRLSDYLFILGRYFAKVNGVEEIIWKGRN